MLNLRLLVVVLIFQITICTNFMENFNKTIWVYWQPPIQTAPLTIQLCYEQIKLVATKQSWQLVLLNNHTYQQYVSNMTHLTLIQNQAQHYKSKPQFINLLRLTILSQRGGLWIDISTVLIHGLKWLQNMYLNQYLFTNFDFESSKSTDLILPYVSYYEGNSEARNSKHEGITNFLPGYANWFIAAKVGSPIITQWLKNYQKHYTTPKNSHKRNQIEQSYFLNHITDDQMEIDRSLCEIIQKKQQELDRELGFFEKRKNANQQLNIIGFHAEYGPMAIDFGIIEDRSLAMMHSLKQISDKLNVDVNFFVRLTQDDVQYYQENLKKIIQLSIKYPKIFINFTQFLFHYPAVQYCQDLTLIVQDSVIGRLIKDNPVAIKNNIYPITIQQRKQLENYCRSKVVNITKKEKQQYDLSSLDEDENILKKYVYRLLNFFVRWNIISGQQRLSIKTYLQDINWKGSYSDAYEVYYWKKINQRQKGKQKYQQQKVENQNYVKLYQTQNQDNKKLLVIGAPQQYQLQLKNQNSNVIKKQQNQNKQSWISLQILYGRFKLKSSHAFIVRIYQILCTQTNKIVPLFTVMLLTILIINTIYILLKHGLHIIKWLVKLSWGLMKYSEVDEDIKWDLRQLHAKFCQGSERKKKRVRMRLCKCMWEFLCGIGGGIVIMLFYCWVMVTYQRICFDGLVSNQQLLLISIILIKKWIKYCLLFSNFFSQLNFMIVLRLSQLFKIMLPLYYFCMGCCLMQFAYKRQEDIFAGCIVMCGITPCVVKQISNLSKMYLNERSLITNKNKRARNISNSQENNQKKSKTYAMFSFCSSISSYVQFMVLAFLILSYLLPNMRYYYTTHQFASSIQKLVSNNNGGKQQKLITQLFTLASYFLKYFFLLLIGILSLHKPLNMFRQVLHEWINNKIFGKYKNGEYKAEEEIILQNAVDEMFEQRQIKQKKEEMLMYQQLQKVIINMKWFGKNKEQGKVDENEDQNVENSYEMADRKISDPVMRQNIKRLLRQHEQFQKAQKNTKNLTRMVISPIFFQHLGIFIIYAISQLLNFYIMYQLMIGAVPQLIPAVYRNIWREKVASILVYVMISYQVQRWIKNTSKQQIIINNSRVNPSANNIGSRIPHKQSRKPNNFENQLIIINLISLLAFQYLRYLAVRYLMDYLQAVSKNKFELIWQHERQINLMLVSFMGYMLMGYVIIDYLTRYWINKEEINVFKRIYKYLLAPRKQTQQKNSAFCQFKKCITKMQGLFSQKNNQFCPVEQQQVDLNELQSTQEINRESIERIL